LLNTCDMMYQNGGNIMPVKIDGPAGRQEVTDEYRKNYDRIFNGTSASTSCGRCGASEKCKDCTPQCDHNGGKYDKSNS
jgi:hypothetical protein